MTVDFKNDKYDAGVLDRITAFIQKLRIYAAEQVGNKYH